jgi:hypothetical protein
MESSAAGLINTQEPGQVVGRNAFVPICPGQDILGDFSDPFVEGHRLQDVNCCGG